jgi:hypothetical protein
MTVRICGLGNVKLRLVERDRCILLGAASLWSGMRQRRTTGEEPAGASGPRAMESPNTVGWAESWTNTTCSSPWQCV